MPILWEDPVPVSWEAASSNPQAPTLWQTPSSETKQEVHTGPGSIPTGFPHRLGVSTSPILAQGPAFQQWHLPSFLHIICLSKSELGQFTYSSSIWGAAHEWAHLCSFHRFQEGFCLFFCNHMNIKCMNVWKICLGASVPLWARHRFGTLYTRRCSDLRNDMFLHG